MVERAEQLPNAGGITTTIVITMDADTHAAGGEFGTGNTGFGIWGSSAPRADCTRSTTADTFPANTFPSATFPSATFPSDPGTNTGPPCSGLARTGHGYLIPATLAKRWAGGEARIMAVLLSKTQGITAYSSSHRICTEQQRLALIARDRGCSFPGCDSDHNGAKPITSSNTAKAYAPASITAHSSAVIITATTNNSAGSAS